VVSGDKLARLSMSSTSLYFVILNRWRELRAFAGRENLTWPLEPTIRGAWHSFSTGYNYTAKTYEVNPTASGRTQSLQEIYDSIFMRSAGCNGGLASKSLPAAVRASDFKEGPPDLAGAANLGRAPAWIEFQLARPNQQSWQLGGVQAKPEMKPVGNATHVLSLDGSVAHVWRVRPHHNLLPMLTWRPATPTTARTLRIASSQQPSWVAWVSISVFTCGD